MTSLFRKLGWLARRNDKEAELQEELQFHLDEEADERRSKGLSAEEAQRVARRELGNIALLKENTRGMWTWTWFEQLLQDLRYAFRTMAANKTFTGLAILSLALGIGANTAIFSFMDAILLRSLPVSHPESLVTLAWHTKIPQMNGMNLHDDSDYNPDVPDAGLTAGVFAYPAFELLQKSTSIFSSVFGYQGTGDITLTLKGRADSVKGEYVSGGYFSGLGVAPAAGRLIYLEDDRLGAQAVAVVSYGWAQAHLETPENAAGQSVLLNNIPFLIVGVTPPGFFGADPAADPDVYVPMHTSVSFHATISYAPPAADYLDPRFDWVDVMGRLRPGVSAAQAQIALDGEYTNWQRSVAPTRSRKEIASLVVKEGRTGLDSLRREYSKPLYILFVLVGLILAVACANIANLMLARAAARRREIALRLSLGAGRFRVIRQLLTESLLLAMISGALGIGFARWGVRVLTLMLANGRDNFTLRAQVNTHVLFATATLSVLTGLLFGLAPSIQSTRGDLTSWLKELGSAGRRRRLRIPINLSRILIVAQIAIAVLILVTTGLFVRTLSTLESIQLGFNRESVMTFRIDAKHAGRKDAEIVRFYSDLQSQFAQIPGVRSVGISTLPLIGMGSSGSPVRVFGDAEKSSRLLPVGAGFFSTMQVPILLGREINERDLPGSPLVAVVNQAFAKINVGDPNPVGRHIAIPHECASCDIEIVGLAADAHYGDIRRAAPPTVYLPFTQGVFTPFQGMTYELRTAGNPAGIVSAVREAVRQADAQLPVTDIKTQSELIDETINSQVMFSRLCSAFAILAMTIASIGLYGTMSYKVSRQTSEIAIRMALGAQRTRILWMVLGEVLILLAVGIALSVPVAIFATKLVASFLFGVKPNDPVVLAGAVFILTIAAVLAGYLPAREASRTDPMVALRHQ